MRFDVVGERLLAGVELPDRDRLDVAGEDTQLEQGKRSNFYSCPVDRIFRRVRAAAAAASVWGWDGGREAAGR